VCREAFLAHPPTKGPDRRGKLSGKRRQASGIGETEAKFNHSARTATLTAKKGRGTIARIVEKESEEWPRVLAFKRRKKNKEIGGLT